MRVLILGVNGFIGNALTERILQTTDWHVSGLDIGSDKIAPFLDNPRFTYLEGDIAINKEWIEYQVKKCDVVLPLVAIATPAAYVKDAAGRLRARLRGEPADRQAGRALREARRLPVDLRGLRDVPDAEFDEDTSPLVYGPIQKQRWIYSCSKQLLDRVIWAYGDAGAAVHALPAVQLVRAAPRRHRLAQGGLQPRADAVPPQHPVRRADQARRRRHAAPLVHVHLRRHRRADGDPREPRRRGGRRHLQRRQSRPTTSRSASSPSA